MKPLLFYWRNGHIITPLPEGHLLKDAEHEEAQNVDDLGIRLFLGLLVTVANFLCVLEVLA